jgi:hypothetical protein
MIVFFVITCLNSIPEVSVTFTAISFFCSFLFYFELKIEKKKPDSSKIYHKWQRQTLKVSDDKSVNHIYTEKNNLSR